MAVGATDLPAALESAVPAIVAQLPAAIGSTANRDTTRDTSLARVALLTCNRYAPDAPPELLCEAATRLAAWLAATPPHLSEKSITDPSGTAVDVKFTNAGAGAGFRRSGARVLLSPYRMRRFA